jgi:hypothetical protein
MSFKVKDLIKQLEMLDPELHVLIAGDEEGNTINALQYVEAHDFYMIPDTPYAEYYQIILADEYEDAAAQYTAHPVMTERKLYPGVVLWPST